MARALNNPLLAARTAIEQAAEAEALRVADRLSSGPYSSASLRAMGHPYSRRRPRPPANPGIINRQTGRFASSWSVRARFEGGRITLDVENSAPYAEFLLHGTRTMISRPYEAELRREMRAWVPRALAQALRRAMRR